MEPSRRGQPQERNIGWEHGKMLGERHQFQCNYCHKCFKGGGVTRLKQHLAGNSCEISACSECPPTTRQLMRKNLAEIKAAKERAAKQKAEVERQAAEAPSYHLMESQEAEGPDEEAQIQAAMRASLDDRWQQEEVARHRARFGPSFFESGAGSGGSRQDPEFQRTTSVREGEGRGRSRIASILGGFGSRKKSFGGIPPGASIHDVDPHAFPRRDSKQQRVDTMWKKEKKKDMWRAIGSWFHFSHIPANAADNTYYKSAISAIQTAGPGVDPPGPRDIYGELLDNNKEELENWIGSYKSKWPTYGLTLMCDGWTGPTKRAIINFLTYCDTKTFFHKSVDASDKVHNASYILRLMEEVIDQIGEENIVQVVTDNGPQYKLAGQVLMERRPQIFWTPCAAHCIDLILMDIGKICRVQHTVEIAQRITRYIYSHTWVLSLMRRYAGGEILRPGVTRFATNYIALDSLIEKKGALRQMFVSPEWQESRYAQAGTEGSRMEDLVSRQSFWQRANAIVKAIKPLYEVLRAVDSERYPQMGFLYHMMEKAKAQIMEADVAHAQEYIDIIERRWGAQMGRDLHLAAYYLNPRFQYESGIGMDDELLHALRNVIYKMEPDPEVAALCIEKVTMI
ncbi:uncharacterized protein LOC120104679 [Phoenix dactylifera]|uniref:Uncharacterized protein LOC120104679 n=1 Tax=Phoenix dactylifera TaxID=42345 RepID=A0A8B8ZDH2_PHODC|nr:uncharacterized protein LOC120104679 [Phoenix dactylifera]